MVISTGIPGRADTRHGSKIQIPSFPLHANTSGSAGDNPSSSTPHAIQLLSTIHARRLPLPKTLFVQRVTTFLTENKSRLRNAVHPVITYGTIVILARDTFLVLGSGRYCG